MHEKHKIPGMEQKTCGKGPKLRFDYSLTYKTLHCLHGIPKSVHLSLRNPALLPG